MFTQTYPVKRNTKPVIEIPDRELLEPPIWKVPPFEYNLVTRADWGARTALYVHEMMLPYRFIALSSATHTKRGKDLTTCISIINTLQKVHIYEKHADDIQFNFIIGGDARVYEGRGWFAVPQEVDPFKRFSGRFLHIAFMGEQRSKNALTVNISGPEKAVPPSFAMRKAAWEVIAYGVKNNYILQNYEFLWEDERKSKEMYSILIGQQKMG